MIGSLADAYLESTPLGSAKWLPEKGPVACLMGLLAKAYPGTMAYSGLLCRGLCGYAVVWYTTCPRLRTELVLVVG